MHLTTVSPNETHDMHDMHDMNDMYFPNSSASWLHQSQAILACMVGKGRTLENEKPPRNGPCIRTNVRHCPQDSALATAGSKDTSWRPGVGLPTPATVLGPPRYWLPEGTASTRKPMLSFESFGSSLPRSEAVLRPLSLPCHPPPRITRAEPSEEVVHSHTMPLKA